MPPLRDQPLGEQPRAMNLPVVLAFLQSFLNCVRWLSLTGHCPPPTAGAETESALVSRLHYKRAAGHSKCSSIKIPVSEGLVAVKCWRLNPGPLVHAKWALKFVKKHGPMIGRSLYPS